MRCLFFAAYRDVFGADEIELELPEGSTVGELIGELRARTGPAMLPARLAVAVNREYVAAETVLQDRDEAALIPPVAGG